jgi:B9 domain-containing protein 2
MSTGTHEVDCLTWAPEGGVLDRLRAFLWGGAPRLSDERAVACSPGDRHGLRTGTRGIVRLRLSVIARHFARHNVSIRGR